MTEENNIVKCGLCKLPIQDYIEGTAQAHKNCFQEFLINFNIPREEVVGKIEHIVELQPNQNSILHFRLGTELIPASQDAIEKFKNHLDDIFGGNQLCLVTSTLVDLKVVKPE